MTTLNEIMRNAFEALSKPAPPDPFNGATHLYLAADVAKELLPTLEPFMWPPGGLNVMVRPALPPGTAYGTRRWKDGDPEDMKGLPVIVFVLAPKESQSGDPA